METPNSAPKLKARKSRPFAEMTRAQKYVFIGKLALCIITFGMAFPNVMSD
jgi:hypothetical protein